MTLPLREFIFLKRRDGADVVTAAAKAAATLDASGGTVSVHRVLPAVDRFTPEPQWDALVQIEHASAPRGDDGAIALAPGLDLTDAADPEQIVQFLTRQEVILDGPARGVRVLSLPRRKPGLSPAEFSGHYVHRHGALVSKNAAFATHCNRYVQHHQYAETVRATGGFVPYDGISEFHFDSVDAALSAWLDPSYMAELRADELNFVGSPPSHRIAIENVEIG